MRAIIFVFLGFVHLTYSQNKVVEDSLLLNLNNAEHKTEQISALKGLVDYYFNIDLLLAEKYSQQSLEIAKELGDRQKLAQSYNQLGAVFFVMGNYDKAQKNFYNSLKIADDINDNRIRFIIFNNLGNVNNRLERFDLALNNYFEALQTFEILNQETKEEHFGSIVGLYNNIGSCYYQQNNFNESINYYEKGIELLNDNEYSYYEAMLKNNMGRSLLANGKKEEALRLLDEALQIRISMGNDMYIAQSYNALTIFYLQTENKEKARLSGENALHHALLSNSLEVQNISYQLLYEVYKFTGEIEESFHALEKYKLLSDSLINETNIREMTQLQMQYEYDKIESERAEADQKRKLIMLIVISLLSFILIIIALLLIIFKNRAKRIDLENEKLVLELETKNKELTTNVMYMVRNNEIMNLISEKLLQLKNDLKPQNKKPLQKIVFELNSLIDQKAWEEFEYRFQQVHTSFYNNLQSKFPDLTPAERKLAAFLRLNMTTKEIASILGLSSKSVEVSRYRLRKKLNITNKDVNLVNFLESL